MGERLTKYLLIEEAELVCRMVEAFQQDHRPAGLTADEAVAAMPPDAKVYWLRVASAVRAYLDECWDDAPTIQ